MRSEEKLEVFQKELQYIKTESVKEFTKGVLIQLPEYFWTVGASSTGKYHPKFSLGEGGLINHVKVAVTIAMDLMQLEMMSKYTQIERDAVISSLLLHDGIKYGLNNNTGYVVTDHPMLIAKFIENNPVKNILDTDVLNLILGCLRSHMGEWCSDYKTKKEIMPKPKNKLEHFVHLCDYLSSRKYFTEFDFSVNVVRL